jgi:hypothetical protein
MCILRISSATLTEVFPCFSFSCKAIAMVKLAKTRHGQNSSRFVVCVVLFVIRVVLLLIVLVYVLFVCKCVLYYCQRVATKLQLTNIYQNIYIYLLLLLPLALQPAVGFGLSNKILPFFPVTNSLHHHYIYPAFYFFRLS